MSFEYETRSSELSSNEKLLEAKAFLENLPEVYEVESISSVGRSFASLVVDKKKIWVNVTYVEGSEEDYDFELTIDGVDFTNNGDYRAQAFSFLESAQKIADQELRERFAGAVDFLEALVEPYEIEQASLIGGRAANGIVDGHRIDVNFVDGFEQENGFELAVDYVDFTGHARYREFALNFLNKVKEAKSRE